MTKITVLIPTYNRPAALAVSLSALGLQSFGDFDVLVSDQSDRSILEDNLILSVKNILELRGHQVTVLSNLPRRGLAQQRQFLLERSPSPYSLFLDDDVLLEPYVLRNVMNAIQEERCGFVGQAVIGARFAGDLRPREQSIEFWEGRVQPEAVRPDSAQWNRHVLHNAANLLHVAEKLNLAAERPKKYKVAWVGGCVLYDTQKLRATGGFNFWKELPQEHAGEDVLAQLKVMEKFGGCGLIPSGAFHLELPTTMPNRTVDAPKFLRE